MICNIMWRARFRKVKDEFLEETARMREILREEAQIMSEYGAKFMMDLSDGVFATDNDTIRDGIAELGRFVHSLPA